MLNLFQHLKSIKYVTLKYPLSGRWQPEILIILSFIKIPPNLPFPRGGFIPLFGKEGEGEILRSDNYLLLKTYTLKRVQGDNYPSSLE
jgi:hypothetical protein